MSLPKLPRDRYFNVPVEMGADDLGGAFSEKYSLLARDSRDVARVFYDTFDWRLLAKGLLAVREDQVMGVYRLEDGTAACWVAAGLVVNGTPTLPEDGLFSETVAPIVGIRALLPALEIHQRLERFRVCNEDVKTIAFLDFEEAWTPKEGTCLNRAARIKPVRGYDGEFDEICRGLERAGLIKTKTDQIVQCLRIAGREPLNYRTKPEIKLDPGMSSGEAMRGIYLSLSAVIRANLDGIRQQWDTEFLHDFRVAVRRTRSGLGLIKDIFEEETLAAARTRFAQLGQWTNEPRDLDVYLLDEDRYRGMLPDAIQSEIDPVFDYFRDRRAKIQVTLMERLDGPFLGETLDWWEAVLRKSDGDAFGAMAAVPVGKLARGIIFKKYKKVRKRCKAIGSDTPDEAIHRLRIDCKKLRYLLEFFAPLYPKKKMSALVGPLKKMQNALGDFNDLSVQQAFLPAHVDEIPFKRGSVRMGSLAVGFLTGVLHEHYRAQRGVCLDAIESFRTDPGVHDGFQIFFSGKL